MTGPTFKDLEHEGWQNRAAHYDDWFGQISSQAFPFVLDAAGSDLSGLDTLDICCGPGHLVALLAERGAHASGLDFAGEMIRVAVAQHPEQDFDQGDAEDLPYENTRFDLVSCCFGLLHFHDPDNAIAEAFRVLRHGGRYIVTAWQGPEEAAGLVSVVMEAIQDFGTLDLPLPPAPPLPRFGKPDETHRSLAAQGFKDIETQVLPITWRPDRPEAVLDMIEHGMVRTTMMMAHQEDAARDAIRAAIVERVQAFDTGDGLKIPVPALMAVARKPD